MPRIDRRRRYKVGDFSQSLASELSTFFSKATFLAWTELYAFAFRARIELLTQNPVFFE
jgi:hypothetical protein